MVLIAKGISGFYFFETNCCSNITSFNKIDWVLLVGKHLHDTADTLILSASHIQYIATRIEAATIAPEESQATHEMDRS